MERITFSSRPAIVMGSAGGGGLEGQGPLVEYFDILSADSRFERDTWEKGEAEMISRTTTALLKKARLKETDIDLVFAGDLTNQCTASSFGLKDKQIPYAGLYGACSTFVLGLGLSALTVDAGKAEHVMVVASSHFCTAERQYRFPLEYGCQRTPTAQTTVTACGAVILGKHENQLPYISEFMPGVIRDLGITDTNDMGAAMAPAACDTLVRYFSSGAASPEKFDAVFTGDLGQAGSRILADLLQKNGLYIPHLFDCGMTIYDLKKQNVHAGGSGAGCSASVFSGYILYQLNNDLMKNVLLVGTGALLSPTSAMQKESIPGVAHLVRIQKGD